MRCIAMGASPSGCPSSSPFSSPSVGVALLFWVLVPPLIAQTQELVKVLPAYIGGWEAAIDRMAAKVPALRSVYIPGEHRILLAVYTQVSGQFGDVDPLLGIFGSPLERLTLGVRAPP